MKAFTIKSSKISLFMICILLCPLYPLDSIQLGMLVQSIFILIVFITLSGEIKLPKSLLPLFTLYISPNLIRIFFQDIRSDLILSIARDLICIMTFLIFYSLCTNSQKLESAFKQCFVVSVIFILALALLPPSSFLISYWNPRGNFGFYGVQIGSLFVFSYSYGTFLLLLIIISTRLTLLKALLILLTQSKSVYLAFMLILTKHLKAKHIILVLISLSFLIYHFYEQFVNLLPYLKYLITTWTSGSLDPSTKYRLVQFSLAMSSVETNPFFGHPQSQINIENQYFYWLSEYGIIGFSMRATAVAIVFASCTLGSQRTLVFALLAVMALSFPILEAPKISLIVWGCFGALCRIKKVDNGRGYVAT